MTRENPISCEAGLGELMMFGNHEAKPIVLGGMQPGEAYGKMALHNDLFLKPQGKPPARTGSPGNQLEYCMFSLEPAGCVARAPVAEIQYTLTELGENEGKAWAGHVLALSLDAGDISLRSLYGMPSMDGGKDSRPSVDRLRIFRMLLDSDDTQTSGVQTGVGLTSTTATRNLVWLDEHGIIEYQAVNGRDIGDHVIYGLPERFTPDNDGSGMRQIVHETLQRMIAEGTLECSQTAFMGMLQEQYPQEGFEKPNRRKYAQRVMNELAESGAITKGPLSGARKSSITLRDSARPVVAQAVAIADGMLSGDDAFMREGREQLRDILGDEERVRTLVAKAFKASPPANAVQRQERFGHVTAVLAEQAAPSSEVVDQLKIHGMTKISTKKTLDAMREEGLVISEPIPGSRELSWELVPDAAQTA